MAANRFHYRRQYRSWHEIPLHVTGFATVKLKHNRQLKAFKVGAPLLVFAGKIVKYFPGSVV
jgi:hypothetical protein